MRVQQGRPEALLGLEHGGGGVTDRPPVAWVGRLWLARGEQCPGERGPAGGGGGRELRLGVTALRQKARVHEAEVAASAAAALDHLVAEARRPAPVVDLMRPVPDLGGEA